ncbi:hypothetical protein HZA99_04805 [Candidatus Woesearchaeota archaeon]|nr:hypothetical protein [Candidatus Woesearchaeota archaeon]
MSKKRKKYAIEKGQDTNHPEELQHTVKEDIISVLNNGIQAILKGDLGMLREESDHIIHCSAIFQRQESIQTAVVIYALAKILERGKTIDAKVLDAMRKAISFMQADNLRGFNTEIHTLFEMINTVDNQLSNYMQHVVTEAQIKKGSRIYEHGISLGQTAEIFGLSQWELMKYVGKTRVSEESVETIPVQQRMAFMRRLFS